MVLAPEAYVEWINQHVGFNPRGQGHSNFLTERILADLRQRCDALHRHWDAGELELRLNVGIGGIRHGSARTERIEAEDGEVEPNIDGVLLRAPADVAPVAPITLENKTLMTALSKARTNRYNDARAYASHVHHSSPNTIAAFTIVINTALMYRNPDAFARSAKASGSNKPQEAVATIDLFRSMRLREGAGDPVGRCEAVMILAIDYDGTSPTARLVTGEPAPDLTSPFGYEGFMRRLCELYTRRWVGGPEAA